MQQSHAILSVFESESYVKSLHSLPLSSIGSPAWSHQISLLSSLNQQSHLDALTKHDEFIVDVILLHDKLPVLINELLTIEFYHLYVLPHLLPKLTTKQSLKLYLLLYSEVTISNLLEVLFYHRHLVEASSSMIVDIEEYCYRKLVQLNKKFDHNKNNNHSDDDDDNDNDQIDENDKNFSDGAKSALRYSRKINFSSAVCSISILRYITDHLEKLPLSLTTRVLDDHDILLSIVPLILNSPFKRKIKKKILTGKEKGKIKIITEKYINGEWQSVNGDDIQALCPNEIQLWLIINNLLLTQQCRLNYQWNNFRQENILKLRPLLTMELLDQLPLLIDVKRFIEELSIITPANTNKSSTILIELIPEIQNRIINENSSQWSVIAEKQLNYLLNDKNDEKNLNELLSTFQNYSQENLSSHMIIPICSQCQSEADKRCSLCQLVWYCGRECQVKHWKSHKSNCEEFRREKEKREKQKQEKINAINNNDNNSDNRSHYNYREEEAKQEFSSFTSQSASSSLSSSTRRTGPLIELIED